MKTRMAVLAIAGLSILALMPIASAEGARKSAPFCTDISGRPVTIQPGKTCKWWPLVTEALAALWRTSSSGSGNICAAVAHYPGGYPIDGYGRRTNWKCVPVNRPFFTDASGRGYATVNYQVAGGFGAVYGQAAILNYSTRPITFITEFPDFGYVIYHD